MHTVHGTHRTRTTPAQVRTACCYVLMLLLFCSRVPVWGKTHASSAHYACGRRPGTATATHCHAP
eukprot:4026899-Lingulodinium_polyedra.AAC.1